MTWHHRVIFNHCELKWSDLQFPNFISLMTLNWWWNKPTYGSAALWTQPWLFLLSPTFPSIITWLHHITSHEDSYGNAALWTQPSMTEIFHHDGPTAAFNIHLESSFGVGSQWQLKWTVNQLFTWLTNFIAMGPRPHSTSSWKLPYGHSRNSAVHHMMVNLPMLFKITPGGIEGATRGPEMAACFGFWGFWSQNYMINVSPSYGSDFACFA